MPDAPPELLAIAVGNSRTRLGHFAGAELRHSESVENGADLAARVDEFAKRLPQDASVAVASVSKSVSGELVPALRARFGTDAVLTLGVDAHVPMSVRLDDQGIKTVGIDRLLSAYAAWQRAKQACCVIDIGTAITVDFVDGEGAFCGGAIAPGLSMMLDALHARTDALPHLAFDPVPDDEVFGINTPAAMRLGVQSAARGVVRELTERYALSYGAYPQIIATGGDMGILESLGLVEHFVPDLQLFGLRAAWAVAVELESEDSDDSPSAVRGVSDA